MKYLILLFLFLSSCDSSNNGSPVSLQVDNPVKVNFQFVESKKIVDKIYLQSQRGSVKGSIKVERLGSIGQREGFHYYKNDECYLVLVKPSKLNYKDFESLIGHEMNHCFFGVFHPAGGKLPGKIFIAESG